MGGAPSISSLFAQRVVISVGDMAVSSNPQMILSTYALGSCVGVVAYDPLVKVGGILHVMLPDSTISPDKAAAQPAMFADTGLPNFFRTLMGLKASHHRLRIFVAGGACVIDGHDFFRIGENNTTVTMNYLQEHAYSIHCTDLGGSVNRTLHLEINTGNLTLKRCGETEQFSLAAETAVPSRFAATIRAVRAD